MKIIKVGVLAFSMATLTAACGNGNNNPAKADSTGNPAVNAAAPAATPKIDTPTAAPAKPDTSKPATNK